MLDDVGDHGAAELRLLAQVVQDKQRGIHRVANDARVAFAQAVLLPGYAEIDGGQEHRRSRMDAGPGVAVDEERGEGGGTASHARRLGGFGLGT